MQIASHNKKHKHLLHRDSSLAAVTTITVLLLVAFIANTCVHILKHNGYSYLPSSFGKLHIHKQSKCMLIVIRTDSVPSLKMLILIYLFSIIGLKPIFIIMKFHFYVFWFCLV